MSSSVISANGRGAAGAAAFFTSASKTFVELVDGLLHAQAHQAERGARRR